MRLNQICGKKEKNTQTQGGREGGVVGEEGKEEIDFLFEAEGKKEDILVFLHQIFIRVFLHQVVSRWKNTLFILKRVKIRRQIYAFM